MCDHGREGVVWLPSYTHAGYTGCHAHLYCLACGVVRAQGSDRGRALGYFTGLVGALRERGLTAVQCRLLARRLMADELFADAYGAYFSSQCTRFFGLLEAITGLSASEAIELLHVRA